MIGNSAPKKCSAPYDNSGKNSSASYKYQIKCFLSILFINNSIKVILSCNIFPQSLKISFCTSNAKQFGFFFYFGTCISTLIKFSH